MTAILDTLEVAARLDSLDMASPILDRGEIERRFIQFYREVGLTAPIPIWFRSTHEYRQQLLDLNIYGTIWGQHGPRPFQFKNTQLGAHAFLRHQMFEALESTSSAASDCWHYNFLHDENILIAMEAGLGWFFIRPGVLILTPRPAFRMHRERNGWGLHSTRGPAVKFADDPAANQWWLRGVRVRQFVVEEPERITRAHIRAAQTPRLRRAMIDQYGLLKYSIERGLRPVDHNEQFGATLYAKGGIRNRVFGNISERECVLELINSTPEPDGTHRHFARRVPRTMNTAHEAVAWTFGLRPEQYNPTIQT